MTAPLFLVDARSWRDPGVGDSVALVGAEARHAATVARVRVGESVLVCDGVGGRALVRVDSVAPDRVAGVVLERLDVARAEPSYTLVQALAKGDRDEAAVEMATELGVDTVVPWQAGRSIVQWRGERAERGRRKWESVVATATKQSRRAWLPVVEPLVSGAALVARLRRSALVLVLHEEATLPLGEVRLPGRGEVALVVGPEGGIGADELAGLIGIGALAVRLGPEVLRTSTAGPVALAVLASTHRWPPTPSKTHL